MIYVRAPVAAGTFYDLEADRLRKQIEGCFKQPLGPKAVEKDDNKLKAVVAPHAGYMYSGAVAGETISSIIIRDKIILLGPNHTGYGAAFSIMSEGSWQTPLGEVKIDSVLANAIMKRSSYIQEDALAHQYEHSLEVELPFLQYVKNSFEIVPIVIAPATIDILKKIGQDIASVIKASDKKNSIMILASSDMTHYEPQTTAEKKDRQAIQAILELDEDKLIEIIQRLDVSMCGFAPVIVMLSAVKLLGAKSAKLIKYQTSGDVTKDTSSVVGYAGITIS